MSERERVCVCERERKRVCVRVCVCVCGDINVDRSCVVCIRRVHVI